MTHFDAALLQQFFDLVGQFHESQQIAHGGARAPDGFGRGLVRQAEFLDQPQQRPRLFQGVEVLALNILDEGHGHGGFVGHVANDRGNVCKPRHLGRAPAPLAGDDFIALRFAGIAAPDGAHQDGLHEAL
jgi:hypothetical protein